MNYRKTSFPLLLLAAMLGTTPAFADFDFSTPPNKDRNTQQAPQDQTKAIDSAVSGVRNALGQSDGHQSVPAHDDLSNAGASVYGGAEDGDRRSKGDPGRVDVNSSMAIGLPNISMPSVGMPSSSGASASMPGIPNPLGGSSGGSSSAGKPSKPGSRGGSQASAADRALDKSLEGFDGIIRDEQQQARERQQAAGESAASDDSKDGKTGPTTMADAGGIGTDANANSEIAMLGDQPAIPSSNGRNSSAQGSAGARNSGNANGKRSSQSGGADSADKSQSAQNRIPDDIEPVSNRDIVGRQIKEAALAERDPVLRDKLWEELRRHQAGL